MQTATDSIVSGTGRTPGALRGGVGEDEAREVGAGLGGGGDVLLAGQTADLDERPRDELGELRRLDRAPS